MSRHGRSLWSRVDALHSDLRALVEEAYRAGQEAAEDALLVALEAADSLLESHDGGYLEDWEWEIYRRRRASGPSPEFVSDRCDAAMSAQEDMPS